ncbi:MAG: hypothetical protein K5989_01590 [Lachnospiraceae bacterium]|nr:hypothetical protein [Lachnospiraceae bacterium]
MKNQLVKRILVLALSAGLVVGMTACGNSGKAGASASAAAAGSEGGATVVESDPDAYGFVDGVLEKEGVTYMDLTSPDLEVNGDVGDISDKAGDLDASRLAYLVSSNDGDKEYAQESFEDEFGEAYSVTDDQKKQIAACYPQIALFFARYGVTNYDFSKPCEADESYITYDVYNADSSVRFDLSITMEDGAVTDVDFSEE